MTGDRSHTAAGQGARHVLVVDDHVDTGQVLVRLLRHSGCDAASVESGLAALSHVGERHTDLVILDVMMPGMTGLDVLRQLRRDPRFAALPVVMYSACTDDACRGEALRLGAQDYVVKGRLDFPSLRELVRKYVGEC